MDGEGPMDKKSLLRTDEQEQPPMLIAQPHALNAKANDGRLGGAVGAAIPTAAAAPSTFNDVNIHFKDVHSGSGGPVTERHELETAPGYKDVAFTVLFLVHLFVISCMAVGLGIPAASAGGHTTEPGSSAVINKTETSHPMLTIMVVMSLVGGVFSALWINFMKTYAKSLIKCTLYLGLVTQLVSAVMLLAVSPFAGVVMLFFAAMTALYIYQVQDRIDFASANLTIATEAVRAFPATVMVAYGMMLVQFVWVLVWGLAFYGLRSYSDAEGGGSGFAQFLMLVSFFWGSLVVKNIVHCTTAGSIGSWWFNANASQGSLTGANPTSDALKRACTVSFGSICLGSLAVAVLKAVRTVLDQMTKKKGQRNFLVECLRCLVRMVENAVEYFNSYAYVQIALYGKRFTSAGYDTYRMFQERGWTTIINDNLIDRVMSLGSVIVGAATAAFGALWASASNGTQNQILASATVSFLIGFGMCMVVTSVIDSAVATIFVCFAEDPSALSVSHPEHFETLVSAWAKFHPEAWHNCGYAERFQGGGGRGNPEMVI